MRDDRDRLTGLPNRRALAELVTDLPAITALAYLDLDRFQYLNMEHGHLAGDEVLCRWSELVVAAVGASGRVARWGGDELLVILPARSRDAARPTIERVLDAVRGLVVEVGAVKLRVTCSAGLIALVPGTPILDEIARADAVAYEAKRAGRDCIVMG